MISLDLDQFIQKASDRRYFFIQVIHNNDAGYSLWLAEDPAIRPRNDIPYEAGRQVVLGSRRERVRYFKTLDAAVGAMHRNGYRGDIRISRPID